MSTAAVTDPTYDPTRDPAAVMAAAVDGWTVWHPGDGTKYHVAVQAVTWARHSHLLLVAVVDTVVALTFTPKHGSGWTATRFAREGLNPPGGYDWWPQVIRPLLDSARAVK